MVGRNLIEHLHEKYEILSPSSKRLNLLELDNVKEYLDSENPNAIVHCAGLVGGIQANKKSPFSFFYNNLEMGKNLIDAAHKIKIPILINLGSSCMYPKDRNHELQEDDILTGSLEPTNEGYALAKISVAKMCEFLAKEKEVFYKTIIPCNLYGKWDKFDPDKSHMVPSVIRKLHLAKLKNEKAVIWGDGTARREFMYAKDLADFISLAIIKYDKLDSYTNVGLGYDYSINEYYTKAAEVIGFDKGFEYDLTKPTGMKKKLCSVKKQTELGWKPKYDLKLGLEETYNFFIEQHEL